MAFYRISGKAFRIIQPDIDPASGKKKQIWPYSLKNIYIYKEMDIAALGRYFDPRKVFLPTHKSLIRATFALEISINHPLRVGYFR